MKSISINVEKMMYGYTSLNIAFENNVTNVSWTSIADGGIETCKGNKNFKNKNIDELIESIKKTPFLNDENNCEGWELFIEDENGIENLKEFGYSEEKALLAIIDLIEKYFKNSKIVSELKSFCDI